MCQHIRFFNQKDPNILTSLGLITGIASQAQVADSICPAVGFRLHMLNLKRDILGPTVTTGPIPLFEEVLSDFIAKERALLILLSDLGILHLLQIEFDEFQTDCLDRAQSHQRLTQIHTFACRLKDGGSHPAFRLRLLKRGFL